MNPTELLQELVRLYDDGIRPQCIRGSHREEEDFYTLVINARKLLRMEGDE